MYGGRWNSKGQAVVYTSGELGVAVLENIVHLPKPRNLTEHSCAAIHIPESLISKVGELPVDWKTNTSAARSIGNKWIENSKAAVLEVPCAIIDCDSHQAKNYLLNPNHPQFNQLTINSFESLDLDPRIV